MNVRAFKFRFYPTKYQQELLAKSFGCSRVVYNKGLDFKTSAYKQAKENVGFSKLCSFLTKLKQEKDYIWLNEVSSVCLQQSLKHLDRAYTNFFKKRAKFPKYKNRNSTQAIKLTKSAFSWNGKDLKIAKSKEPLKIHWSRGFKGEPTGITITKDPSGRYFVSLTVEDNIQQLDKRSESVGIDLGLTTFATLSNGEKIKAPKPLTSHQKRLRKYQKDLCRAKKASQNRTKKRERVAKVHAKIKDIRQDFNHKLSTKLIRENQAIMVESLSVKNMMKNKCLAKNIGDVGWRQFLTFLKYKAEWYGRNVIEIDQFFPSSKICSSCQFKLEKLDLSIRKWQCPNCQVINDRDLNASINIHTAGQSVM